MSKVPPKKFDWKVFIGIGAMHLLTVLAFVYPSVSGFILFLFLSWLTGWIGITLCYHRLLTHRSFKTPKWFEYFLTIIATLAWQGGPIQWIGNHRLHHAHADTDDDPHTPKHGFTWAHVTWLLYKNPEGRNPREVAKDLERDKWISLIDRYFWLPQIVLLIVLSGVGYYMGGYKLALSWIGFAIGARTTFAYHFTWFVNSAAHTWGYRNFETADTSTNNWWVAGISGGEGWHNNHHADQSSARHGMRWYEIDPTWYAIKLLSFVGLAYDIKSPRVKLK